MKPRVVPVAPLVLFVVFAAYGYEATQIVVFPGQELEPFKPRTMPVALAVAGLLFAAIRMLQVFRQGEDARIDWRAYDWTRAALMCMAMLGYGLLFVPLGFVAATTLFLLTGFLVLGERRRSVLLILPLAFTLVFWALMTQLLDLYLAPGLWWPAAGN